MSAGSDLPDDLTVHRDLDLLAPAMESAMIAFLADCHAKGLDAVVFETYRSNKLQRLYYARGRTVIPPERTVTNAKTNTFSWHGYSLAADVISEAKGWNQPDGWFQVMGTIAKAHGLGWGGEWPRQDLPHVQWGGCPVSPTTADRTLLAERGVRAVWTKYGAI